MIQSTLVLLKPDAVKRGLVGRVVQRLEEAGLKIIGCYMATMDDEQVGRHYRDLEERIGAETFAAVSAYVQSGPIVALAVQGCQAVTAVRKLVGATFPSEASPGTIRGDFAHQGRRPSVKPVCNLIHASGTLEDAAYELDLWFPPTKLFTYKRADEEFTL
jgi:nucleoside-diphosphate kinase